jgi:hypothetical protein
MNTKQDIEQIFAEREAKIRFRKRVVSWIVTMSAGALIGWLLAAHGCSIASAQTQVWDPTGKPVFPSAGSLVTAVVHNASRGTTWYFVDGGKWWFASKTHVNGLDELWLCRPRTKCAESMAVEWLSLPSFALNYRRYEQSGEQLSEVSAQTVDTTWALNGDGVEIHAGWFTALTAVREEIRLRKAVEEVIKADEEVRSARSEAVRKS